MEEVRLHPGLVFTAATVALGAGRVVAWQADQLLACFHLVQADDALDVAIGLALKLRVVHLHEPSRTRLADLGRARRHRRCHPPRRRAWGDAAARSHWHS